MSKKGITALLILFLGMLGLIVFMGIKKHKKNTNEAGKIDKKEVSTIIEQKIKELEGEKMVKDVNKGDFKTKDFILLYGEEDKKFFEIRDQIIYELAINFDLKDSKFGIYTEKYKKYDEIKKEYDGIKGSPALLLKKDFGKKLIEKKHKDQIVELKKYGIDTDNGSLPTLEEAMKEAFEIETENYYVILMGTFRIGGKNECKDGEELTDENCGKLIFLKDERCTNNECDEEVLNELENVIGENVILEVVDISSEKGKELKKKITESGKKLNFPSFMFYGLGGIHELSKRFNIVNISNANNEIEEIDTDQYLIVPYFLKNDWTEDSKQCTFNEELLKDKKLYQSCSVKECDGKKECIEKKINSATIFAMGECVFCKDHFKKLYDISRKHENFDINVAYLVHGPSEVNDKTTIKDINSLHGETETKENALQICVKNVYGKGSLFKYMKLKYEPEVHEDSYKVLSEMKFDKKIIDDCIDKNETAIEMIEGSNLARTLGIKGTPTWVFEGKTIEKISDSEIEDTIKKYTVKETK